MVFPVNSETSMQRVPNLGGEHASYLLEVQNLERSSSTLIFSTSQRENHQADELARLASSRPLGTSEVFVQKPLKLLVPQESFVYIIEVWVVETYEWHVGRLLVPLDNKESWLNLIFHVPPRLVTIQELETLREIPHCTRNCVRFDLLSIEKGVTECLCSASFG